MAPSAEARLELGKASSAAPPSTRCMCTLLQRGVRDRALGEQPVDEVDGAHLRQQAGVEGQLVDAVQDLGRACAASRRARSGLICTSIRSAVRAVAGSAATAPGWPSSRRPSRPRRRSPPPGTACGRQAEASTARARAACRVNTTALPVVHVGGRDEHLELARARAMACEVDLLLQQVAQRIDVQRIALVGRDHAAPGVADHVGRRQLRRQAAPQHAHELLLQRAQAAERARRGCQMPASCSRAPSRGSLARAPRRVAQPLASATALTAPALVPLRPSRPMRPSASRASSTPQVNAPWEPPPCRARLSMRMAATLATSVRHV